MEHETRNKDQIALALPQPRSGTLVSQGKWNFPQRHANPPPLPAAGNAGNLSVERSRFTASGRPRGILNHAVNRLDAMLRRRQKIFEFCDEPHCLLRVAVHPNEADVKLPTGLQVRQGEVRGELHLWNEHLPGLLATGADLLWAVLARRRMRQTFSLLARAVQSDPRLEDARVFYAVTRMGAGRPRVQMERIAMFYGFELVDVPGPSNLRAHLVDLGERIHLCAMMRTFNPKALTVSHLISTQRHQLWMSREVLLSKYAAPPAWE